MAFKSNSQLPHLCYCSLLYRSSNKGGALDLKIQLIDGVGGGLGSSTFPWKSLDFESSVNVKILRDGPHLLDQGQAWNELQLFLFIQWSEFFKYLDQALKV